MFKSIFVPTTGFSNDPATLETALLVARSFRGHLDCVHVHPDPTQILVQAAGYDMGMGTGAGFVLGDIAQVLEEEDLRQTGRAKKVYEAFLQREKLEEVAMPPCARCPSAAWTEIMGREQDILTAQARVHDLTVIGHPTHWGGLTNEVAGAMLVGSGRPVLLAPPKAPARIDGTIAVAWKDTPEAARALTAAMPLLARAKQVVLINIAEHEDVTVEPVAALAKNLRWHDINVDIRYLAHSGGTVQGTILTIAGEVGADLLVMGGYSHYRLSERLFGGFTREVLAGAPLPIFMAH
ncbi:MAG: universal stress protein [Parvibaculum sp.]|uniref:universal stress protein n=1 Tax=Parvibaculum sp. TaxID=2024848 RepID=UPI0028420ECC|nr:universal stress protein [Parvibaculum sp.]MDR3500162.1 universal stress protein [Parvibaculum sp.]